jgi:hypothetical protein
MGEFKAAQHPTQTVVICAFKRANDFPEATPPVQAVQFSRSAAEASGNDVECGEGRGRKFVGASKRGEFLAVSGRYYPIQREI